MTLNLNLTDLSIMSELKTSPFGMWLVDTDYASFSAFDELKGQSPFHKPRPEELLNRTKGKEKREGRRGKKEGSRETHGHCRFPLCPALVTSRDLPETPGREGACVCTSSRSLVSDPLQAP